MKIFLSFVLKNSKFYIHLQSKNKNLWKLDLQVIIINPVASSYKSDIIKIRNITI